jgi:hypothetical protein
MKLIHDREVRFLDSYFMPMPYLLYYVILADATGRGGGVIT